MTTLAKQLAAHRAAARQISALAVVTVFGLVGLVITLIATRYEIDVSGGAG